MSITGGHMFYNTEDLKNKDIYLKLDKTAEEDKEKNWVPAYYFTICTVADSKAVGICDLRIGFNENTYYGGNIGYSIDEPYRGHHYAAKACTLLFQLARKHNMSSLLIDVNPNNIASRKICEYLGGILQAIVDLPPHNDRYIDGERQTCIYNFIL